ncbi:zinc finger zas1 [Fusarium longipes]|uniref:Zinc finger zas1 n=1 Tax=Fusarium longipes TaxID=694270 RepID=A0A395STC8_9HYPO|nr:zinc finger zas1 [Fusarium longipes]
MRPGRAPVTTTPASTEDGQYQKASPEPLREQHVDLSFLETPSTSEVDFLSQLVDIENMVDMSSWTWSTDEMTSLLGDAGLPQNHSDTPPNSWMTTAPIPVNREGLLFPDTFRLPADYTLELDDPETIPVHRLETFARLFFSLFHPFLPLLHIPTFCLASAPPVLVRVICFIGAGFDSDPSSIAASKLIYGSLPSQLAKCCLRSYGASPTIEELQALVLLQFATTAKGGSAERAATRLLHPLLVTAIRHEGLLKIHGECTLAARNAQSWKAWIQKESRKRILWGVYAVDCYQSILCGSKPLLSPTDTRASFPCDDASWAACSASLWAALPAQDPSSCFLSSVKGLMVGQPPTESNITAFSMNLLILAVNSLLLEAQASILPANFSALEQALQTWYASWEQFRGQFHTRSTRTAGSILISNSLSLYYLAMHFLKNGRPVIDERAYLDRSADCRNPLIIKEQVYQDEMMRCVERMLGEFQDRENAISAIF